MIAASAVFRLIDGAHEVHVDAFALAVIGIVVGVDASRALVPHRAARRYHSAAFAMNVLHFGSDLAGSLAVLVGLLAARAGYPEGDAIAALFVSVLVLTAASRLIQGNVDVLMDRSPATAGGGARGDRGARPGVQLRRLRMRRAAGRHFADVVIGVPQESRSSRGTRRRMRSRRRWSVRSPGADVIVHVEPLEADAIRERAYAAALREPRVREVHNMVVLEVGGRTEVSLHLKLPGGYSLADAHEVASSVEHAILDALPRSTPCRRISSLLRSRLRRELSRKASVRPKRRRSGRSSSRSRAPSPRASPPEHGGRAGRIPHPRDGPGPPSRRRACSSERRRGAHLAGAPGFADVVVHTEP